MPGTLLAMGLNSPRTSAGASGLGSQASCCVGQPGEDRTLHALALPDAPPFDSEAAATVGRASSRAGSDSPNVPSPPTRSHSLRVKPSQRRDPRSKKRNMRNLPVAYLRTVRRPESALKRKGDLF